MTRRQQTIRSIVFTLLGIVILAGLVYYLYVNSDEYLHLVQVSAPKVIAIALLALVVPFVNGLFNVYLFQSFNVNLSGREGFYLAASATLANLLPLPGGMISRGIYLKQRHGLSYVNYLSASLALFFCTVAANGFIGVSILLYWLAIQGLDISMSLLIGFSLMAGTILIFWAPLTWMRFPGKIGVWIDQTLKGWAIVSRNRKLLSRLVGLQIGFMLLFALRQWLAFHMLSQNISIGQAILLSSGSVLTQIISFAPGGLGVREAIVGAIASALGFDLTVSIAAVELDRLVASLIIIVTGWAGAFMLGEEVSRTPTASPDTNEPNN